MRKIPTSICNGQPKFQMYIGISKLKIYTSIVDTDVFLYTCSESLFLRATILTRLNAINKDVVIWQS